ncbi:hypothetical protein ACBG85_17025 [Rhodococcus sp. NyZ502]|uniref:TRADD-N-associated membrane domain-containing protein n=1 Tax=Rhodococcus sp. NyZ502 TaxID=3242855 RepID=UPI003556E6D2
MILEILAQSDAGGNDWYSTVAAVAATTATVGAAVGALIAARERGLDSEQTLDQAEALARRAHKVANNAKAQLSERLETSQPELEAAEDSSHPSLQYFDVSHHTDILVASLEADFSSIADEQAQIYLAHLRGAESQNNKLRAVSLWVGLVGILAIFAGCGVTMFAAVDIGVFTAACGAVSTGVGALIFKQANAAEEVAAQNFAKLNESVAESERLRRAVSLVSQLSDQSQREHILSTIALSLVFDGAAPAELSSALTVAVERSRTDLPSL